MATHSSVLAWRIPGMGEPRGLPSMGSQSRTRLKRLSSSSSSITRYSIQGLPHPEIKTLLPVQGGTDFLPSWGTKILHAPWCSKKKKKSTASKAYCLPKFHLFTLLSNFYMSPTEDNCPSTPTHFRGDSQVNLKGDYHGHYSAGQFSCVPTVHSAKEVGLYYCQTKKTPSSSGKEFSNTKERSSLKHKSENCKPLQNSSFSQVLATKIRETLASSLRTVQYITMTQFFFFSRLLPCTLTNPIL